MEKGFAKVRSSFFGGCFSVYISMKTSIFKVFIPVVVSIFLFFWGSTWLFSVYISGLFCVCQWVLFELFSGVALFPSWTLYGYPDGMAIFWKDLWEETTQEQDRAYV